ncbi:MAG: SDR family NAD(P)-dependent oxidoreductase [Spirochaetales bacterium]|nr:SDR family NAD(P)-dependent oxidoreductase [Spirochaetales bacterium]
MNKKLEDKHVLITGSYGNLGRAIAEACAIEGAILHLQGRLWTMEHQKWAEKLISSEVYLYKADLEVPQDIDLLFDQIHTRTDRLDVLINNAGVQDITFLESMPLKIWNRMISVNLTAAHLLTQHFAKDARGFPNGKTSSIVNILSIESERPAEGHSHYAAAKGGLLQYTKAAAFELGKLGIRVNAVSPGLLDRDGIEHDWPEGVKRYSEASPLKRLVKVDEIAESVMFLAGDSSEAVTGINLIVDAGLCSGPGY